MTPFVGDDMVIELVGILVRLAEDGDAAGARIVIRSAYRRRAGAVIGAPPDSQGRPDDARIDAEDELMRLVDRVEDGERPRCPGGGVGRAVPAAGRIEVDAGGIEVGGGVGGLAGVARTRVGIVDDAGVRRGGIPRVARTTTSSEVLAGARME